jgi:hypothetical protein
MAMPEATMNEYGRWIFWQNQVWRTRQALVVQPEPKSPAVQSASYRQLGLRILAPDTRHHQATCLGINYV